MTYDSAGHDEGPGSGHRIGAHTIKHTHLELGFLSLDGISLIVLQLRILLYVGALLEMMPLRFRNLWRDAGLSGLVVDWIAHVGNTVESMD